MNMKRVMQILVVVAMSGTGWASSVEAAEHGRQHRDDLGRYDQSQIDMSRHAQAGRMAMQDHPASVHKIHYRQPPGHYAPRHKQEKKGWRHEKRHHRDHHWQNRHHRAERHGHSYRYAPRYYAPAGSRTGVTIYYHGSF